MKTANLTVIQVTALVPSVRRLFFYVKGNSNPTKGNGYSYHVTTFLQSKNPFELRKVNRFWLVLLTVILYHNFVEGTSVLTTIILPQAI